MAFLSEPLSLFTNNKKRAIGSISGFITLSENASDKLTITKHPVQQGASISDHAYKEPCEISVNIQFTQFLSPLEEIYQDLLELQTSRELITIYTGKRTYENMLITTIGQTTDKNTENVLAITMTMTEIITVEVTATSVPARKVQKSPGVTGKTEKAGNKSFLRTSVDGAQSLAGKLP